MALGILRCEDCEELGRQCPSCAEFMRQSHAYTLAELRKTSAVDLSSPKVEKAILRQAEVARFLEGKR